MMLATRESPVTLTVPADPTYVRLVRLVASSLAADLGSDLDEIEDVRIAADELTTLVIEAARPGTTIQVVFTTDDGVVCFEGTASTADDHSSLDPLSEQLLRVVAASFEVVPGYRSLVARFRSAAPGGGVGGQSG